MSIKEIEKLAKEFGLKNPEHFIQAFNVTKIKNGAKTSKSLYANSSLATLGDAVINLYLANVLFRCNLDSKDITETRAKCENNSNLEAICNMLEYPKFKYGEKSQQSDKLVDDPASLLEAIIGAVFIDKGFEETSAIIDKKIPI